MNSIDDMVAEAQARSANLPATTGGRSTENGGAVAQYQPARAPSLDNIERGGMTVDTWLKVSEDGLKVSSEKDSALLETLKVSIDMNEVTAATVIKFGNPAVYHKTYDGLICADGTTTWQDAIAQGARYNARPYDSADVPMTLEEDVTGRKGTVVAEAGQRIGYSLSTTNKEAFGKFLRQLNEQGLRHATVDVTLGYEPKKNTKGNVWGIVTFNSEGEHAPE